MSKDELGEWMDESVKAGLLKIVGERDGEPLYAITKEGEARVERLIDNVIEYAATQLSEHLGLELYVCRDLIYHRAAVLKKADA